MKGVIKLNSEIVHQKIFKNEFRNLVPIRLAWFFLVFTLGIIITGALFYRSQKKRISLEQERNLAAISILKIGQIENWYNERKDDAEVIINSEMLVRSVDTYLTGRMPAGDLKALKEWMKTISESYDYCGVLILDSSMNVRLTIVESDSLAVDGIRDELTEAKKSKRIIMTDLHRSESLKFVHIDIIIPVVNSLSRKNILTGYIILRIDPEKYLFPLIQSWPVPSKSAETLLLRKNGDSAVFLNELRHLKNTALKLSVPLSENDILGVKAINGVRGLSEGVDYRNVPCLGYLSKINGLSWYMVAKIDSGEVLSPLRRYYVITVVVTLLLIIINAGVFGFWIWEQRVKLYKRQLATERERKALESHFEHLIKYANDIIILTDSNGRIINANEKALKSYGYTRDEILYKKIDLISASYLNIKTDFEKIIEETGSAFYQATHKRKDGLEFQIEISARKIEIDGAKYYQTIGRDITERKKLEEKLQKSEELYRILFENMLEGFAYCKMIFKEGQPDDFIYISVNKAFESLTGLKNVEGKNVSEIVPGIRKADPELLERFGRVASTGNPEIFEIYLEAMKMWFSISVYSPHKDHFVAVFDVITERKRTFEILKESEEFSKRIIESSKDCIKSFRSERELIINE